MMLRPTGSLWYEPFLHSRHKVSVTIQRAIGPILAPIAEVNACACFRIQSNRKPSSKTFPNKEAYSFIEVQRQSRLQAALNDVSKDPDLFKSLLCSPHWLLHLEASSSPPRGKVAAGTSWSFSLKREEGLSWMSQATLLQGSAARTWSPVRS